MFESFTKTFKQISSSLSTSGIPIKLKVATIVSLQTLAVGCNLAAPYLLGKSLGELFANDQPDNEQESFLHFLLESRMIYYLLGFGGALLGSRVFPSISKIVSTSVKNETAIVVNSQMNEKLMEEVELNHLLTTPVGTFVQMMREVYETQEAIPILLEELYPSMLELAGATAGLFYIDFELGLVLLGIQVVALAIAHLGSLPIKALYKERTTDGFRLFGGHISRIQDYENIHLFGKVDDELTVALSQLKSYSQKLNKLAKTPEVVSLAENLWTTLGSAGLITLSLYKLKSKTLPLNYFSMILIYSLQMTLQLGKINKSTSQLVICETGIENTNAFLNREVKITSPVTPVKFQITDKNSTIHFQNVTFGYSNEEVVLQDVDIKVKAGSKTAIVGLTGAGKSTLARLLLRFYEPNAGTIAINDYDIKTVNLKSIRKIIGLVPQLPKLPNGTLREAIRYAKGNATDDEIKEMLRKVKLDNFANEQGLAKKVGERGEKLSGGQMQRIAIVRALIKKPFFYILDEATSALDMETAIEIQQLLDKETAGVTTLVITHQLLTITNADNIIVLDGTKKIQEGTFDSLKSDKNGRFYKLLDNFCRVHNLDIDAIKGTIRPKPEIERERSFQDYKDIEPPDSGEMASVKNLAQQGLLAMNP